jgi:hypothetical protein
MKSIENLIKLAFTESKQELFNFISENYGEDDPDLTITKLNELFPTNEIQLTNDKFLENKGRGRPRKSSVQN